MRIFQCVLLLFSVLSAQIKLDGIVRDANTHRPLDGVNVFIQDTQTGTMTDIRGHYKLDIPMSQRAGIMRFQHISYKPRVIRLDSLATMKFVDLVPRIIPLQEVTVTGEGQAQVMEITKDISQRVVALDATQFDTRGFVDAGDFLKTEHSIQVNEEMSGQKTLSIRGGNPDDIVVLYNGVKMNTPYDNVFDFSLIDLENLERLEVIKGSNTALFGPEAFSGIVNIVPQIERDYRVRAQYRTGTYDSEIQNYQYYQNAGDFYLSYSYKEGEQNRKFADAESKYDGLKNNQLHRNANILYQFGKTKQNKISIMGTSSVLEYDNNRDQEFIDQKNDLASLKYSGDIWLLKNVGFTASYKKFGEDRLLNYAGKVLIRDLADESIQLRLDHTIQQAFGDLLLAYQYEDTKLDFSDEEVGPEFSLDLVNANINRVHHGGAAILKTSQKIGDEFWRDFHVDLSGRYDQVKDVTDTPPYSHTDAWRTPISDESWSSSNIKFSATVNGSQKNMAFKGYANMGGNIKFPTLVQRMSRPITTAMNAEAIGGNLEPEKINNYEIGADLYKESTVQGPADGWHVNANYFINSYENKFRSFASLGMPVLFYDNVVDAKISGFETSYGIYFFNKKVNVDFGMSKYFISEKSAFPFKSDFKRTVNFSVDHKGYSVTVHYFAESEQVGWIRNFDGQFLEVDLEPFTNMDVHFSKMFTMADTKYFVNFSGRNLLGNDDTVLQGLAIRDKRAYLTVGVQL